MKTFEQRVALQDAELKAFQERNRKELEEWAATPLPTIEGEGPINPLTLTEQMNQATLRHHIVMHHHHTF